MSDVTKQKDKTNTTHLSGREPLSHHVWLGCGAHTSQHSGENLM